MKIKELKLSKHTSLLPITTTDIYETNSKNFNKNGLFSTEIFGPVGSDERLEREAYIPLYKEVIHPKAYVLIEKISKFYIEVIKGKAYGIWSDENKEIVKTDDSALGETGYAFFLSHFSEIIWEETDSSQRKNNVAFLNKIIANDNHLLTQMLVYPAGLRDYFVDEAGSVKEDEINDSYRRLINITTMLQNINVDSSNEYMLNPIKISVQRVVNDIHEHFMNINKGKTGYIQNNWAKRSVEFGTRNVFTSKPNPILNLTKLEGTQRYNDTLIGLYQFSMSVLPVVLREMKVTFLHTTFSEEDGRGFLIDAKTGKKVNAELSSDSRKKWLTNDGLEKMLGKLLNSDIMASPITIDGKYLRLVRDTGDKIVILRERGDFKENEVRPLTYGEMIYLSIGDNYRQYGGFITRFPITENGSIYATKFLLKPTSKTRTVTVSDAMGIINKTIYNYPSIGSEYLNSLSPHLSRLLHMDADFDGDLGSTAIVMTKEAIQELQEQFKTVKHYVTPNGQMLHSSATAVANLVVAALVKG